MFQTVVVAVQRNIRTGGADRWMWIKLWNVQNKLRQCIITPSVFSSCTLRTV